MRRNLLHISLALLTFTIGFLSSGSYEDLAAALVVAFIVFALLKKIASFNLNTHHLSVALLTLLIWIPFAALVLYALPEAGTCMLDLPPQEVTQEYSQHRITFRYIGAMRVLTIDRGCIDMDEYESDDGVKVYTSTDDYELTALAIKESQRMLGDDVKVIERSPRLDKYERQIGERIVAIRTFYKDDRVYSFILRREGAKLQYIGSPLLSRALEFEKTHQ